MAVATTQTGSQAPDVHGFVAPGFEPVRAAFARNFTEHGEVGAACCVYLRGEPVVDIHAGLADAATGRPWQADTLQLVFSATKGVTATCVLQLVERGAIDLDAPVARYWPEFAANGKERIPVRWLLSHRAGLAAIEGEFTLDEALAWDPVVTALAAQAPLWEPGTKHGYHLRSYGWLLGELVRRIDGRTPGRFFADEIARPLGLEFWIGLPEVEEPRVSTIVPPEPAPAEVQTLLDRLFAPDTIAGRAFSGPSDLFHYDAMWNRRALHAAELPSSNGIGTARALARLYASLVGDGVAAAGRCGTTPSPRPARCSRTAPTPCCSCRRASASASCCRRRSAHRPVRRPSAIPARAARSPSAIASAASASPTS